MLRAVLYTFFFCLLGFSGSHAAVPDLQAVSALCLQMLDEENISGDDVFDLAGKTGLKYSEAPEWYFTIPSRHDIAAYAASPTIRTIESIISEEPYNCAPCLEKNCFYFTGPLSSSKKPLLRSKQGSPEVWTLTFLIDGSGHFYQGQTLLFPQRTLSRDELDTIIALLREHNKGLVYERQVKAGLHAVDIVLPGKPGFDGRAKRISYYTAAVAPEAWQLVIEYTSDTIER